MNSPINTSSAACIDSEGATRQIIGERGAPLESRIKPVSNEQTDRWFTPEMIDAFMALGERYPDIAAEIYVIASHA